jgi:hypothetical protein
LSKAAPKSGPGRREGINRRKRMRENQDKSRSEELALAVSIILANLSCDEEFLKILLGVKNWKVVEQTKQIQIALPSSKIPAGGILGKEDMDAKDDDENDKNFRELF